MNKDHYQIYESYLRGNKEVEKTIESKVKDIDNPEDVVCFTKEDASKLLSFIDKHSNEYDVLADSTAYNLKQLVLEKLK